MFGQKLRRALANKSNAEPVDDALQRQVFRFVDLIKNVLRRFVGEALKAEQFFFREVVDIGDICDQAALDQLVDQGLAHTVDVHHTTRGEMQNRAEQLSGTICIDTAVIDLP